MPIDARIPLGAIAPQFDNIQDLQARGMQLRQMGRQESEAARADSERTALRDLYKSATGADGTVDNARLMTGLAQIGQGDRIPAAQKAAADAARAGVDLNNAKATGEAAQYKLTLEKLGAVRRVIGAVLTNPAATHDDVIREIRAGVERGEIPPDMGAQMARSIPGKTEQIRPFLMQKHMEGLDAEKQLQMLIPKYDEQDRGGVISQGTIDPLTGTRSETGAIRKTVSPDAAAQADAIRGAPITMQQDANGNLVAAPTRALPGQPIQTQAVLGPDGKPLTGKSNATEDQSKAAGWLAQATNAFANMRAAKAADPAAVKPGFAEAVSAIPSMGLGEALGNNMRSPERQKYVQAASSLSEALLRAATGAGVNAQEAKQKIQELTPQWGDSDQVIAQKEAAVPYYLESLRTRAGNAGRNVPAPDGIARQPGAIPQVKSDADYAALPSGTQFTAPDGTTRTKP